MRSIFEKTKIFCHPIFYGMPLLRKRHTADDRDPPPLFLCYNKVKTRASVSDALVFP